MCQITHEGCGYGGTGFQKRSNEANGDNGVVACRTAGNVDLIARRTLVARCARRPSISTTDFSVHSVGFVAPVLESGSSAFLSVLAVRTPRAG